MSPQTPPRAELCPAAAAVTWESKSRFKKEGENKGFLGISQVETQVAIAGKSQPLAAMLQQSLPISFADVSPALGMRVGTHK